MDSHAIKILGSAEIGGSLDDSKDYSLCYKRLGIKRVITEPLEENGDKRFTYVLENLADLTVIGQDRILQGKNKSNSKRIRSRAWIYSNDQGIDPEIFYDKFCSKLIEKFDSVVEFLQLDK